MVHIILFLNISRVSSKCFFEVWLFNKGVIDDKIAMIAMRWRISGKHVPTSNAQQICIASLHLCRRLVAHILIRVFEELDCKTVRIFTYSSTRKQSNKRSGTRLKITPLIRTPSMALSVSDEV